MSRSIRWVGPLTYILVALSLPSSGVLAQDNMEGELTLSVWGGPTEQFLRDFAEPEFAKLYPNIRINYEVGGTVARFNKVVAQQSNPTIDLLFSGGEQVFAGIEADVLAPIDRDNVPNMEGLEEWALIQPDYGAAYGCIAFGLGYDPEVYGDDPPASWQDLWDEEAQGKVAMPAVGHSQMVTFVTEIARLHGGGKENVQPALDNLAKIDPGAQFLFYTEYNALWNAGDIVLTADFDYYLYAMRDQGSSVEFVAPKEGPLAAPQHISVVKGSDVQEVAEDYLNMMLSPEMQELVVTELLNSPSRLDTPVPENLEQRLTCYSQRDNLVVADYEFAFETRPKWTQLLEDEVQPAWGGS